VEAAATESLSQHDSSLTNDLSESSVRALSRRNVTFGKDTEELSELEKNIKKAEEIRQVFYFVRSHHRS